MTPARHFLGKIFFIIWVFIGEIILQLYLSWCQITHPTKTEAEVSYLAVQPEMEQSIKALEKRLPDPQKVTKVTTKKIGPRHIYRRLS